jgi:uncharacterized membrane protein (DUF485 family)
MNAFRILNNRKRAIIALVHSVFFGLLASYQLLSNYHPTPLIAALPGHLTGPAILTAIYSIVSVVLLVLVLVSRSAIEKLYFAFCATSAGVGLLRVVLGDPSHYAGNFVRVFMLGCGVLTGTLILRLHSAPQLSDATEQRRVPRLAPE